MPQRNRPSLAVRQHVRDPLTACLDADSTYICTAYNSRCYVIQKVTPPVAHQNLNPNDDTGESGKAKKNSKGQEHEVVEPEFPQPKGSVYMNGDVAKVPSGAVYSATPEPHASSPTTDFNLLNGVAEPLDSYSDGGALPLGGQAPPETVVPDANQPSPIAIDQLKQMLSSQLEYYFSRENLANDTYLLSQMDNDQYVPIWTVANFNQVKKLTTDIKLITEVLRESPNVQVDDEGQKVRPNHKRCIVILREIPESTPLEEVKGLFSGKNCPKLISCEFAHNNSWYVTFENDEDAQKAYRFLREEVREFQGKPIMARIKAKPMTMNRLPIPAVGPGITMKNGYRTPPATANSATVYDPTTAYPPGQQRYLFNGTSMPPNVNYNQVQIYFQQQPFYPPNVLPTWGPAAAAAYFDIGSVFTANGLAPQGSFPKAHPNRFAPRRQRKMMGLEQRSSMSDSGLSRGGLGPKPMGSATAAMKLDSNNATSSSPMKTHAHFYRDVSQTDGGDHSRPHEPADDPYNSRPPLSSSAKDPARYRRRKKEDEGPSPAATTGTGTAGAAGTRGTTGSPGPQFDLEADAFPPLPGHEAAPPGAPASSAASPTVAAVTASAAAVVAASVASSQSAPAPSPAAATTPSASAASQEPALHDQPPPPPTWADNRPILGSAGAVKASAAEKLKTDDGSVNGSAEPPHATAGHRGLNSPVDPSPTVSAEPTAKTTAVSYNAAVISSLSSEAASSPQPHTPTAQVPPIVQPVSAQSQTDLGVIKLSYAQVAQHHKEKAEREKNLLQQQVQQQTNQQPSHAHVISASQNANSAPSDEERKESNYYQPKSEGVFSRGRGGSRGQAPRRRDNIQRFNTRQRSPK
ncbi:Hypothetical protein NTJ_11091 [Nesidiocoris tenuis]|uniref:HTH La-type RNA-binding domain-containing protein n=2 Tax=Nesidiocoris tenuis TaxID=355587 RepID=A0ABN7B1H7_9HEMI|nr:Hypothetical protein NTJ_11091 [Nesidiocoris tenuis]